MKNNILIIACLSTTLIHGMEISLSKEKHEKQFSIISHGTTIDLFKSSWDTNPHKIDINVSGYHKENRKQGEYDILYPVGTIVNSLKNEHGQTLALSVEEPCLHFIDQKKKIFGYVVKKEIIDQQYGFTEYFTCGNALEEASKDLKLCYQNALKKGLEEIHNNEKSIAFPLLGIGFPEKKAAKTTIAAFLEYIEENKNAYSYISLFVNTHSEFELYKTILIKQIQNK